MVERAFHVQASADTSSVRNETFMGREFLVIPIVCLVQGVLHSANAEAPELALYSEFAAVPAGWNGRPLMMNHPSINGEPTYANQPKILEAFAFGYLFNTIGDIDTLSLKSEAWIDVLRVTELGGEVQTTIDRINAGETIEVSTGLFCATLESSGLYNGIKYEGIWQNIVPDHLAFLSEGSIGACSIEMGCGTPRINQRVTAVQTNSAVIEHKTACAGNNKCTCNQVKNNSYPPGMTADDVFSLLQQRISYTYGNVWLYSFTQDAAIFCQYDENYNSAYYQIGYTIDDTMKATLTGEPIQVNILTRIEPVNLAAAIKLEPVPQEVEETETSEVEVTSTPAEVVSPNLENNMTVKPNAAGGTTPATNTNPNTNPAPAKTTPAADPGVGSIEMSTPAVDPNVPTDTNGQPKFNKAPTLQEYIGAAPAELQDVLNEGMRTLQSRKVAVITGIKASGRCEYTDTELNAMNIRDLERLARLAAVPSMVGVSIPGSELRDNSDPESVTPAPILAFPVKAA